MFLNSLYGLLGEKLSHSLSPRIHYLILRELGVDGFYHLFQVKREELKNAVVGLKTMGARGINVTIPYKVEVIKYLDGISDEAGKIGAVNTISFSDNRMIGYNTDYSGFGMMLEKNSIVCRNTTAVVLGTGGASKAITQYLMDEGAKEIIIVSRNKEVAKQKYKNFNVISYDFIKQLKNVDMIINCTPVGMYPNVSESPIDKSHLAGFHTAIDLVYNPKETLFLKYGNELGIKTVNGLYMLIGQAVKAQELWNNTKISSLATDIIYDEIRIFFNWR